MVKFNEVKLIYTCSALPPDGIFMNRIYHIVKKEDKFYFTDGVAEFEGTEEFIKMLFTPNGVEWSEVDFENGVKLTKTFDKK